MGTKEKNGMITLYRTESTNKDFIELVKHLDADLKIRDGEEHFYYAQFNTIDFIKYAVVAYENSQPIGCGAIKEFQSNIMEVKRMYIVPNFREKGIATKILIELEKWTKELSFSKCVLETGKKQPEAIELYMKNGYTVISNYGQYKGIENSCCFEKEIQ